MDEIVSKNSEKWDEKESKQAWLGASVRAYLFKGKSEEKQWNSVFKLWNNGWNSE